MLCLLLVQSSQFEWMLHTLFGCYDSHPHEDTHTLSLIVAGILKAVAVLKSVSLLTITIEVVPFHEASKCVILKSKQI